MTLLRMALVASMSVLPTVAAAQPAPPDVVLTGPGSGELTEAVRGRVEVFARSRGLGVHDLADAAPPTTTSVGQLRAAISDYHGFKYKDAVARLDQLVDELSDTGAAGLEPQQLADVFIYRAMSKTEAGAETDARADLLRAASLFPSYKLDEARFRPSLVAAFERARASTRSDPDAVITVDVARGCTVVIDSHRVNAGTISLRPGTHYVQIRCATTRPFASAETFIAGPQTFTPALVPRPSDRARVLAAGEQARLIWVAPSRIRPGRVDIALLDRASRKTIRSASLTVEKPGDAERVVDVLASLITDEFSAPVPPAKIIVRAPERRWYERPWVWATLGAVAASAVILPFALRDTSATGFDAAIEGQPR